MTDQHTTQTLIHGDARDLSYIPDGSVHLVVTSPPYWNLKEYPDTPLQMGNMPDYDAFLDELDKVWEQCARVLIPGGRICCVVGDVCVSRRKGGRHFVMPLPADIQVRSRKFGLDNLTPIIWLKVANIQMEASSSSRFLGKPYLPNGVIKNDFETILMLRKPALGGKRGYRSPTPEMEEASRVGKDEYFKWFKAIWDDVRGASLRNHPAPYPKEIAYRLIRMFSFAGDTILDPFIGTGTTTIAAIDAGRNSIGVEADAGYVEVARQTIEQQTRDLWGRATLTFSTHVAPGQTRDVRAGALATPLSATG
ncbi:MAG TPA: methyltransferase [Chloroflexi bacterium]|jgi:site-specific DNA-methyltransferase (adenine-specific)|nr:methyltransferase [Chloroflexota bacterium]